MATVPASGKASTWQKRVNTPVGAPYSQELYFEFTATPGSVDNDTLKIDELPRAITLTDAWVSHADGDTHATPTAVFSLRVTDGTTPKVLIDGSTIAQGGGHIRSSKIASTETALGFTIPNRNYWLELIWTTKAATPASAAVKVCVSCTGAYPAGAVTE